VDDCALVLLPNLLKLLEQHDHTRPVLVGSKIALPGTDKVYFTGLPLLTSVFLIPQSMLLHPTKDPFTSLCDTEPR
jgi:hypothetical protein